MSSLRLMPLPSNSLAELTGRSSGILGLLGLLSSGGGGGISTGGGSCVGSSSYKGDIVNTESRLEVPLITFVIGL